MRRGTNFSGELIMYYRSSSLFAIEAASPQWVAVNCRLEDFHIWHDNDVIYYFQIFEV